MLRHAGSFFRVKVKYFFGDMKLADARWRSPVVVGAYPLAYIASVKGMASGRSVHSFAPLSYPFSTMLDGEIAEAFAGIYRAVGHKCAGRTSPCAGSTLHAGCL